MNFISFWWKKKHLIGIIFFFSIVEDATEQTMAPSVCGAGTPMINYDDTIYAEKSISWNTSFFASSKETNIRSFWATRLWLIPKKWNEVFYWYKESFFLNFPIKENVWPPEVENSYEKLFFNVITCKRKLNAKKTLFTSVERSERRAYSQH